MKMKWVFIAIGLSTILFLLAGSLPAAQSFQYDNPQPTQAPTPMLGGDSIKYGPSPTSVPYKYIGTAKDALEMAHYYDIYFAKWSGESWNPDSIDKTQSRVTVQEFASRTDESADAGRFETFSDDIEADAGGVWRITIRGEVKLALLGSGFDPEMLYDGVTYVVAKRTGNLLATISGEPIKSDK